MEFTRTYLIRFAHCDPAGIVFFPRYFDLFNDHVEDWFGEALGCGFPALHGTRRMGVPTVHLDCNFANPSRHGDRVEFALQVTRVGQASIHLRREARVGSDVRVRIPSGNPKLVAAVLKQLRELTASPTAFERIEVGPIAAISR